MMDTSFEERAESLRMIRDSAAAVAPRGDLSRIRALRFGEAGFDAAVWRQMGELGWIGLRLPEEAGGAALGMGECCALMEELGRGLVPEPLVANMLSAALLAACGDTTWLPKLLAGEVHLPTAWQGSADTVEATTAADAPRLFIPAPRAAAGVLLPLPDGLHLLPASAATDIVGLQDGGHAGTLRPPFAGAQRLGALDPAALGRALDEAALATAACLLGVMEGAFAMTLDYLRTRHQFGKPIGSFQALQHRAVDLKVQVALTRASVEDAAATLDSGADDAARRAATSRAKTRAAEAAMKVTREAVQMHGAIGYTDEYDVGLYARKAMVLANAYGSAALHRRRFIASVPDEE
jgi:alkylation response protein AidB-like acyl-CoA dehydrogenase